jgi:hypothetical protein
MNKKIFALSISLLFSSFIHSEDVYLLTNSSKVITNEITKSLQSGLFSSSDIKILSSEEKAMCIKEETCIDSVRKKDSKAKIIKFDVYKGDIDSEIFITLINLENSKIEISDYIDCDDCSTIELIKAINSHEIKNSYFAHSLFNERFDYAETSDNSELITLNLVSTPPSKIFIGGKVFGVSPLDISAKKNTKINVDFIDINHKKLNKSIRFDKNKVIEYALVPIVGSVLIKSAPSKADIFINGKKQGRTPKEIKNIKLTETINIELSLKDHITEELSFRPKSESKETINVDLEKGQGFIKIDHDGSSEKIFVYVDGSLKGPLSNYRNDTLVLEAGKNKIRLVQGDVKRDEDFIIKIDAFETWKVSFVESVEVSISF